TGMFAHLAEQFDFAFDVRIQARAYRFLERGDQTRVSWLDPVQGLSRPKAETWVRFVEKGDKVFHGWLCLRADRAEGIGDEVPIACGLLVLQARDEGRNGPCGLRPAALNHPQRSRP